ncbi:putative iron-sulfur cluster scaffold protein [Galdieria sulphuraria]|uniref:Putative iron-sulfur cluster scaffold protein n=1 Tax=Galdieria sulphuraria TaxID=130081 RepID=M2XE77_GALSU|nr:putative iron-sulfur cluster scaffold protein [Galdieria sulphuraria]EME28287.1 putative iron-sulfur cluster scaffold protein [Galdieria sulphuraria]|eukprot:XP_005704807.1 putative iron-sulfur cluster scaffold protein [Galdieria sulphuraria]
MSFFSSARTRLQSLAIFIVNSRVGNLTHENPLTFRFFSYPKHNLYTTSVLPGSSHSLYKGTHGFPHRQVLQQPTLLLSLKRSLFLQSQPTPNPDSVKFLPGREVVPNEASVDFPNAQSAQISPLAKRLFRIEGISSVFLGPDFVTVTKREDVSWSVLRPEIFEAILEFYSSEEPVLLGSLPESDTTIRPEDDEVVAMIKELLETRIKPAVAEDGGNILYRGYNPDTGIVDLELQGSCTTCSSSVVTLKSGVENMLMHYIPEVKGVREVISEERQKMEQVSREQLQSLEQRLRDSGVLRS